MVTWYSQLSGTGQYVRSEWGTDLFSLDVIDLRIRAYHRLSTCPIVLVTGSRWQCDQLQ